MSGKLEDLMRKMELGKARESLAPSLLAKPKSFKNAAEKPNWKKKHTTIGSPIAKKLGSGKH